MRNTPPTSRPVSRSAGLSLILGLLAILALPADADARGRRVQPVADLEVRTMVSTTTANHVLRAVIGVEEIYQYLMVERIRRGATEGDRNAVRDQARIDKFVVGGQTRAFPTAPDIRRLRWQDQVLHFVVSDGRVYWRCMLAAGPGASFLPRCDTISKGEARFEARSATAPTATARLEPVKPVKSRDWGADAGVVKGCSRAMSGAKNINNCVKVASRFKYNPRATIAACGTVMSGSARKTQCLMAALKANDDRSLALRACERAVSGGDNRIKCFKLATRIAWEPSGSIAACHKAMSGSRNVLGCILTVKDASASPHAAIASCTQSMSGAKNRLQCIKSASQR